MHKLSGGSKPHIIFTMVGNEAKQANKITAAADNFSRQFLNLPIKRSAIMVKPSGIATAKTLSGIKPIFLPIKEYFIKQILLNKKITKINNEKIVQIKKSMFFTLSLLINCTAEIEICPPVFAVYIAAKNIVTRNRYLIILSIPEIERLNCFIIN